MFCSIKKTKLLLVVLGVTIFAILGAVPYFLGPGLTQSVAVGAFLNGHFPDVSLSSQPYRPAFPNLTFDSPLTFADVPNSNVLIVGQRNGEIYWFDNDETVTTKNLMADLSDRVGLVWDGGFLGLAIHPEFGTPGKNYFYTYYTSKDRNGNDIPNNYDTGFGCNREDYWGGFLYLRRYEVDPVTFALDLSSELTMLKLRMFSCTHRGGSMDFGTDGYLYLTTGEQSAYAKPQNITTNLDGGVLRLDVNQDPTKSHPPIRRLNTGRFDDEISGVGYGIPNDNPFLSPTGTNFEEYYTLGHRNPHRMTKDKLTGTFYIGEVGESRHEEINVVKKGMNYGWPVYEGNVAGPGAGCTVMYNGMPMEAPLVAFPRSEANTLIGGYVYRGTKMPELYGKYICADYGTGEEIWSVDINTGAYTLITQFSPTDVISFGEDNTGELYLLPQGDNVFLYKLIQVDESPIDSSPQLLSETGAFQNLLTLEPSPGLIPYDLIESFWSDGAEKKRWLVIPNDGTHNTPQEQIKFSEDGDWDFPVGSVLIKHFEMPIDERNSNIKRRLETRFEIKASSGDFYFLTYKWNNAQTDAVLLDSRLEETIQITAMDGSTRNQTWTYPGTPDCIACHNPATKGTLGPRTRFLNSDITYPTTGLTANQLVTLSHLGILDVSIDDTEVLGYQTHKAIDDPNATLDEKARSYLDNNCAYCHRPGGTGERAQFDLRLSKSLVETGLMYANTNTPLGIPGERIVVGGDASKSILFHRTESIDQTIMMPPMAKNVVDQKGVDLIELWINQLDPNYEDPRIMPSTYRITNVGSGLVMDIAGVSQANLADVHQWAYVGGANQHFIVTQAGGNYYKLKAVHSNKNVDVEGLGQAPGTNVIQYQENGTDAQLFLFEYLGDGKFAIKTKANGLYLGIENKSIINGGSVKTYPNDGSNFFKWTFTDVLNPSVTGVTVLPENTSVTVGGTTMISATVLPNNATNKNVIWSSSDNTIATVNAAGIVSGISDGLVTIVATTVEGAFTDAAQVTVYNNVPVRPSIYTITNVGSTLAMDIFGAYTTNLADVIQWPGSLDNNQRFIITPATGIYYTIKAVHSNKNLNVLNAGEDQRNLVQYEENGTDAQLFSLEYLGSGMYAIKSKMNGLYAGIEGNSSSNAASVKTYPNDGSNYFKWRFTDLSTTYTYNNGWAPNDPNGISYPNDLIVINSGEAVISSNTICDIITVNPGAALTINSGVTLTASTTTLKSTSQLYSSLIANGSITGILKYERFVNAYAGGNSGGNDLVSTPLSGQTWAGFLLSDTNATDLLDNGNTSPIAYAFGPFDKTADAYVNYTNQELAGLTLISGQGYRAATNVGTTLTFTGAVVTSPISVNIVNTGANFPDWNLIGNPYPSYLDMDLFLTYVPDPIANPGVRNIDILENASGIYGYNGSGTSNKWDVITLANAGARLMAPGQGFFVAADAAKVAAYDIVFHPLMRAIGTNDDFIPNRNANLLTYLKLKASTSKKSFDTEFYFNSNASVGLDHGYDGKILGNVAPDFAIYSHLIQDNTGLPIALQALNPSDLTNTIIPLGVNANKGEQITFTISETTLPMDVQVYLEDKLANTFTLLNTLDYTLTPNTDLSGTGRFFLRISSRTLSDGGDDLNNLMIYTTANPKSLIIKGQLKATPMIYLYDINGRLVLKKVLNPSDLVNTVDISRIGTGVYFAKVFNNNQIKTQKLVIK